MKKIIFIIFFGLLLLAANAKANVLIESSEAEPFAAPDPALENLLFYSTITVESAESEPFSENLSAPIIVDNIDYSQALLSDIIIESGESRPFSFIGAEVLSADEKILTYSSQIMIESSESPTFTKAVIASVGSGCVCEWANVGCGPAGGCETNEYYFEIIEDCGDPSCISYCDPSLGDELGEPCYSGPEFLSPIIKFWREILPKF